MSVGRLISIPFALGQDEATCPRELPMGAFREAINVRQRRGKQLGMRADYLAQSMTEFDGTLTPYDLYGLNGRLVALGNRQVLPTARPTDLFDFVEQPGGTWKGTLPVGAAGIRVPPVTGLRNVGQPPDIEETVSIASVAAVNGLVCLVYGVSTNYVHIFDAETDATILFAPINLFEARAVAVGNSFWIVGVNPADQDIDGYRFDTTADDDLQPITSLFTGTVTSNVWAICQVTAASITQFAIFCRNGVGVTRILRFNEAGVNQLSVAGPAVSPDTVAIEADSIANQIVIATRTGVADANLSTYNLTTGALVAGPTAAFGEAVTGDLSIVRLGPGGNTACDLYAEDAEATGNEVVTFRFTASTLLGSRRDVHGYIMGGRGVQTPAGPIMPLISADRNNQLVLFESGGGSVAIVVVAQTDLHIANGDGFVLAGATVDATTGKFYWARILEGTDGQLTCSVSEFLVSDTGRRQACQVGNELFITGASPIVYDSRQVTESGFLERPVFASFVLSNGAGQLTVNSTYKYVAVYKWTNGQNRLTQSAVSGIFTVNTGATDDTVTLTIYAPHTLRRDANSGSSPTISIYRTEAGGSLFTLAGIVKVPLSAAFGAPVTFVDTISDAALLDEEPVYTQGEDGPVSGVLSNDPPPPCRYCWTVGQRVFIGGLPDESEVAISKELAPAEALAFSEAFAFRARVEGTVTAVAGLDGVPIAFTAERIYRFPGLLPNDQGADGQLGPAIVIPSEGGCDDWRSILETSHGLFYKARDGKLMLLPRGDGSPIWIGQAVRDVLASFPEIVATAYSDEDHCALFCCVAADGLSSTILVFDLRIGQWYRDTFASAQVIKAATGFRGRLAYIDGSTVRLQSASLTPSAFIPYNMKTGSIVPWENEGQIIQVTAFGEFRGNCQVRARISYDDGVNFTDMKTFTLATPTFTVGQIVTLQWWPRIRKCAAFVLDFQVLTNGTATEGLLLNEYVLEVIGPRIGRARTASAERG